MHRMGPAGRMNVMGFAFNAAYLLLAFLVPLYALKLGFNAPAIGTLAAVPSFLQLPLRTLSGPLTDFFGERRLLFWAFIAGMVAGSAILLAPGNGWALVVTQIGIGCARGLFWIPAQTYLSRVSGDRSKNLGLFTSWGNTGALCGILGAGPLSLAWGFSRAFGVSAALQAVCLLIYFTLRAFPHSQGLVSFRSALVGLPRDLMRPVILLCGGLAFLVAVPQSLVQSFYPVYLTQLGNTPTMTSMLAATRSLGMIVAGFTAPILFRRLGSRAALLYSALLLVVSLVMTAATNTGLLAIALLAAGISSGWLNVLFLSAAANASNESNRATYLGLTQVFFVVSMMITPVFFGQLAGPIGLRGTFVAEAGVVLLLTIPIYAFWNKRKAASREITPGTAS